MAVNYWGIASLGLFFGCILMVGIYASRNKKKKGDGNTISEAEDHMLAGRNMGVGISILSMTSTWFDGGFICGTAQTIYSQGFIWVQGPVGYALSLIFGGLIFAKRMREKKFVTLLDPFQEKYGDLVGALVYIPCVLTDTLYIASIFSTLGDSVTVMVGIDPTWAIIASAIIAVLYTLIGGMYSVSYTDVISIFAVTFGLVMCIPFAVHNPAMKPLNFSFDDWFGKVDTQHIGIFIDTYIMLIVGGCSGQIYYQRVLSCKSAKQAQTVSYLAAVCCLTLVIPPMLIGYIAKNTDWTKTAFGPGPVNTNMVLPMVFQYLTPTAVSFVGLGVISAAVMSASDATILGTGSMFARNVYKRNLRPNASEGEIMWVVRIGMVVAGCISVIIALNTTSISGLWYLCGDFAFVFVFPQMLGIICFENYCNAYGAISSSLVTFLLRLLAGDGSINLPFILKFPFFDHVNQAQLFPFKTTICIIAFVLLLGISCLMEYVFKNGWIPMKYDFLYAASERPSKILISDVRLKPVLTIQSTSFFGKPDPIPSMDYEKSPVTNISFISLKA